MSGAAPERGALSRVILWSAALLIPRVRRREWLEEWRSELWYVRRSAETRCNSNLEQEKQMVVFCWGAFRDAWFLRRERDQNLVREVRASWSAVRCTVMLALIALSSLSVALLLPNVRKLIQSPPLGNSREIMVISPSGSSSKEIPLIRMKQFRLWQQRSQHLFSAFGFYEPVMKPIQVRGRYISELTVARASGNLLAILGTGPSLEGKDPQALPTLLVSEAAWQREFHGDSTLLGSTVEVGLRKARLGGVLANGQWRLPGSFDAWLLEPGFDAPAITSTARGFVVARLISSLANRRLGERWSMTAPQTDGEMERYDCVALSAMKRAPLNIYVFTVLLALFSLPATTSIPLGEYPVSGDQVSWSIQWRRWMFLAIKFSLLLPVIYLVPLDLAHAGSFHSVTSEYVQIISSFLIALFGFRWALQDQRRRCPVCLCRLTHPARVGQPSRNFLAWHGTELICTGGHGLLHVPELPTSWFATQRWLYLDTSWNSLFPGTV